MPSPSHPRADAARTSRVIGVLGGIASGKSFVAQTIAGKDGLVIDADRIAREVLDSPEVTARLSADFGSEVLGVDGRPDRDALAARVFASTADRARLESLTHPLIRAEIRARLERAIARGVPRIVLDVPLLLEHEVEHALVAECDELVFVATEAGAREARAVATRGWKPGEVARREAAQLPLSAKRARADHVITNHGSLDELEQAVLRWLAGERPQRDPHQ